MFGIILFNSVADKDIEASMTPMQLAYHNKMRNYAVGFMILTSLTGFLIARSIYKK